MTRIAALIYGVLAYLLFVLTLAWTVGFVGNLHGVVPRSIDAGGDAFSPGALAVDLLLLAIFGLQHSVMARPAFKRLWTRVVPAVIERSTYVLLACASLDLLYWRWQPLTAVIWSVHSPAGQAAVLGLAWLGCVICVVSSFLVSHTELFGLRQVGLYVRGRPYTALEFLVRSFYRRVRHPIYLGTLLAFWAAPLMTAGHLLFAAGMTGYVLLAIPLEERDLAHLIGDRYRQYRARTPMLIPRLR